MITLLIRKSFERKASRVEAWKGHVRDVQLRQLQWLLTRAASTRIGSKYGYGDMLQASSGGKIYELYGSSVPRCEYEDIRHLVELMLAGERDVLWPGRCDDYAQSSGTSGGKSKYVPITPASLRINHYGGGSDAVGCYLRLVPESRLFDGKGLILGGSFANELHGMRPGVHVGDLSATLINKINPAANFVRVPSKRTALISDWGQKLPAMVRECCRRNVTNISGVPSWMLTVLRTMLQERKLENVREMWPNLEVFFHGGISFEPYRHEYEALMGGHNIHYLETYNASEGFFSVQNDFDDSSMLLLLDRGIFFEFLAPGASIPVPAWEVEEGRTYELIISSCNGLWRYSPGDTVLVTSTDPVKIRVAGRTHSYINAFGEELMEWNAERAMGRACGATGAEVCNYTVAPVYASSGRKGRHQWLIEWQTPPTDEALFAAELDKALQEVNSDYQAKRRGGIFLESPEIVTVAEGAFHRWLHTVGNRKLGGQRKVPRLSNNREIADSILGAG